MPSSAWLVLGLCSMLDTGVAVTLVTPPEDRVSLLQTKSRSNSQANAEASPCDKDHPVCVALYYTSYCPKTVDFVKYQLPALMKSSSNVEMSYIPFGFMNDDGSSGRGCAHGKVECYSNVLHRCALRLLDNTSQVRRCHSPFLASQSHESLYTKFLQCHAPAIWEETQKLHRKTKNIITGEASNCLSKLGLQHHEDALLTCTDDAWEQRSEDEYYSLAQEATNKAALGFLPTFKVRCPGEIGLLQEGAVLPEEVADGNQKGYDFLEWVGTLCHDGAWPHITFDEHEHDEDSGHEHMGHDHDGHGHMGHNGHAHQHGHMGHNGHAHHHGHMGHHGMR